MKQISILLGFLLLFAFGCSKEAEYRSKGEITGQDIRMCVCCGGWFIKIDNSVYLAPSLPAEFRYDFTNAAYPIPVKLDWELMPDPCTGFNRIEVSRITTVQ
jgi:hypothetical protein